MVGVLSGRIAKNLVAIGRLTRLLQTTTDPVLRAQYKAQIALLKQENVELENDIESLKCLGKA